jgi:hypothetical protein
MNSRTSQDLQNQLTTRLSGIATALNTLKSAQRVSGSSGVLNYLTNTGATWDLNETIGTTSDTSTHGVTFTITFVADGTQAYPNQTCLLDLFITSPIEANRLSPQASTVNGVILVANPTPQNNALESYVQTQPATFTSTITWSWKARISNQTIGVPFTYYLRVSSVGSSRGTISVTRTVV